MFSEFETRRYCVKNDVVATESNEGGPEMDGYSTEIDSQMPRFFDSLARGE